MTDYIGDMAVERRKVSKLRPHPQNSRKHSKEQVAQIWASITRTKRFTNPILIDENDTILAGHGRWAAAKHGKMPEVPVIVLRGLSDHEKRAYIIADNRIAEGSEWDKEKLMSEVAELMAADVDLTFLDLGGIDDDLAELVGAEHDHETPEDKRDREEGQKKKRGPAKAGGDDQDDDQQQGGDPSKDKNSVNFPLYVVLTPVQHKAWKALRGQLNDKQFVQKLLDSADLITDCLNPK